MIICDLNACPACTTDLSFDVGAYTALCSNHANYIKTLLQLDSTPKTINFGPAKMFSAQLPKHLQHKGFGSIVTFGDYRFTRFLDPHHIELLLAPPYIQKTVIEINEFIS